MNVDGLLQIKLLSVCDTKLDALRIYYYVFFVFVFELVVQTNKIMNFINWSLVYIFYY